MNSHNADSAAVCYIWARSWAAPTKVQQYRMRVLGIVFPSVRWFWAYVMFRSSNPTCFYDTFMVTLAEACSRNQGDRGNPPEWRG